MSSTKATARRNPEQSETTQRVDQGFQYVRHYDKINKWTLEKTMVDILGNDDTVGNSTRRLLQAAISYIEGGKIKPKTWENAELHLLAENMDSYMIRSGNGQHMFVATFDATGNPEVVQTTGNPNQGFRYVQQYAEINKSTLEKSLVDILGNEVTKDDTFGSTRQLFQAAISYIDCGKLNPNVWKNAELQLFAKNLDSYMILSGEGQHLFVATFDARGNPEVVPKKRKTKQGFKYVKEYAEINKRTLGKSMVAILGNEGTNDDTVGESTRRLFQAAISYIDNEKLNPDVWKDAELQLIDDNMDSYMIHSGKGRHQFVATFDASGNPDVIQTTGQANACSLM